MLCYYTPPVSKMQEFFWPHRQKPGRKATDAQKKRAHRDVRPRVLQKQPAAKAGRKKVRPPSLPRAAGPQPALPAWARRRMKSKKPMVSTVPSARQIKAFCTKPATIKQIKLMAATAAA